MRKIKLDLPNAILGFAVSFGGTFVFDYFKKIPFFTTGKNVINWVWEKVFCINLLLWQVVIAIILISIGKKIYRALKYKKEEPKYNYFTYKTDSIGGIIWRWDYERDFFTQKINITNLSLACPMCETTMIFEEFSTRAHCPRCGNIVQSYKDIDQVKAVIIDNISRKTDDVSYQKT